MPIEELTIDSTAYTSQCGIFLARSTTSINCNNNKFKNVYLEGSYSVACVVNNGAESQYWMGGRWTNANATPNHRVGWFGGGTGVKALQNITPVNGGTVLDTGNPCTDNKFYGIEFYGAYATDVSYPWRFSQAAEAQFFGCTIVTGVTNNGRLVTYGDPVGSRFNGPVSWFGCHMEVNGTGNVIHYLNGGGASVTFNGINSYGGYWPVNNNTAAIDYDRTNVAEAPTLEACTWTTPSTSPNSSGTNMYAAALFSCAITFKPNNSDGNLFVSSLIQDSTLDVTTLAGPATRFLNCLHSSVATALPPTSGTYTVGETISLETPTVGSPVASRITVSGTFGTYTGGTATCVAGSNSVVLTSAGNVAEGQIITIGGGGLYIIRKWVVGTLTAYLDNITGITSGGGKTVAFSPPTIVPLLNLATANTGWGSPTGAAVVNNYSGSAATLVQTSNAVAQLITDLKALGVLGT